MTRSDYMPQLDGLRTVAVAAVAWSHWMPIQYMLGFELGHIGVRLFFVLSGFLITGILIRARDENDLIGGSPWAVLKSFYARRFLRIFPLYYAVVILATIKNVPWAKETFVWNVTYLTNFFMASHATRIAYLTHFWSLAVEEQFYFVWPWLLIFIPRRAVKPTIIALVGLSVVFRYAAPLFLTGWSQINYLPFSCLDSLGLGALLAIMGPGRIASYGLRIGLPGFALIHIAKLSGINLMNLSPLFESLFFVWLVSASSQGFAGITGRFLSSRTMVYLGSISYGMYVFHNLAPFALLYFIGWGIVPGWVHDDVWVRLPILIATTVCASALSWHLYEKPLNSLKRLFPYVTRKLVTQTA